MKEKIHILCFAIIIFPVLFWITGRIKKVDRQRLQEKVNKIYIVVIVITLICLASITFIDYRISNISDKKWIKNEIQDSIKDKIEENSIMILNKKYYLRSSAFNVEYETNLGQNKKVTIIITKNIIFNKYKLESIREEDDFKWQKAITYQNRMFVFSCEGNEISIVDDKMTYSLIKIIGILFIAMLIEDAFRKKSRR